MVEKPKWWPKRNVALKPVGKVSSFRKLAMGTWDDPRDPQIYGTLTVRMEKALAFIERYRRVTGRRLTVTHLVAKAVARALAEVPEANALIRRDRPQQRQEVSVFFSIATEDPETGQIDLSGAKLDRVDEKDLAAVLDELEGAVQSVRAGTDEELERSKGTYARLPFAAMRPILNAISLALYGLNLDLTRLGLPKDPFGSAIVTNIGSLGLSEAYAPLMAYTRTPILLAVGAVRDEPVVENGEVVPGKVMGIHATLDHRLIDGKHAALLSRTITRVLEDPEAALGPIEDAGATATELKEAGS
jgi:pyruvate/2-oxoglutarate dehydrogenase complex dihydrolipoamide acyltransferase (E2) component